jgi:DnaK suppressor protein
MDIKISHLAVTKRTAPESSARFRIDSRSVDRHQRMLPPGKRRGKKLGTFLRTQRKNLLELRAALVDSMTGIAREARQEKPDSSALSTHPGDAGSDACERDFVLSLLSQGADALLEIDEALARIETGTYGTCEMSGRPIPLPRLRSVPFARLTVECQAKIEHERRLFPRARAFPSPFSVADDEQRDEPTEASD